MRSGALPAQDREDLGIGSRERVLAWSELAGGGVAAATVDGVRARTPRGRVIRRSWAEVDHAAWDQDSRTVVIWWLGSRQSTVLELPEGSFLPEVIRERVQSSVVLAREVAVPGGAQVWVALRRTADGELVPQVVPGRGVRLDDPAVAGMVRNALRALASDAGLPESVVDQSATSALDRPWGPPRPTG